MKKEMTTTIDDFIIEDTQSIIVYSAVIGGLEMTISEETAPQETWDDVGSLDHLLEGAPSPEADTEDMTQHTYHMTEPVAAPLDRYALIYPGTRCDTVPREDIIDAIQDYIDAAWRQISSYPRADRYEQIIDDQIALIQAYARMAADIFGLKIDFVDGRYIVTDRR